MIHMGIDPGVHTGVAFWHSDKRELTHTDTLDFWSTVEEMYRLVAGHLPYCIHIENPNANKPVFLKKGIGGERSIQKIAQNVGSNKREASLLIELCKREGWNYQEHVPKRGKLDSATFRKFTGITRRMSQHERDAAMLVYGR